MWVQNKSTQTTLGATSVRKLLFHDTQYRMPGTFYIYSKPIMSSCCDPSPSGQIHNAKNKKNKTNHLDISVLLLFTIVQIVHVHEVKT